MGSFPLVCREGEAERERKEAGTEEGGKVGSTNSRAEVGWCGRASISPGTLLLAPDSKPPG